MDCQGEALDLNQRLEDYCSRRALVACRMLLKRIKLAQHRILI
jgi:hypothetical protein